MIDLDKLAKATPSLTTAQKGIVMAVLDHVIIIGKEEVNAISTGRLSKALVLGAEVARDSMKEFLEEVWIDE